MKRTSTSVWKGTIKNGTGSISTASGVLKDAQYSYKTRFEDGIGTNPEELIAAAHSACFNMKLSAILSEANYNPEKLETICEIEFEDGKIKKSFLRLKATIPDIEQDEFERAVVDAKDNCPISQLLNTKIDFSARLNE
ncbi:osmotically inducible protein OsmC [Salinimicrobium marinum]|uniref:Osmotically inducible protein OsmC n=1 Tax=Salinimicrobium marinum TaxID=680283 RepID=A0A918VWR0_9FLAO|nr:OsmC family protein [Salinimicrobium marinum]GHA31914.1 osmotically inducible protein OsmC [Salinimicrobium marinum]